MYDYPGRSTVDGMLQRWRRGGSILWETHHEGERLLRAELEQLRGDGYEMVHDRLLEPGGRAAVDTILVGPGGVFVFDAKHWWGKVTVEQNRLIQERRKRRDRTDEITKLLEATKKVGQVASSYVHPYLVLTGEAQMPGSPFVGKVRIRGLHGTADTVRSQIQTVPPHDVRRIFAAVDAAFPPRSGRGHEGGDSSEEREGQPAAAVLPTRPRPVDSEEGARVAPSLLGHLRGTSGKSTDPKPAFSGIFSSRMPESGGDGEPARGRGESRASGQDGSRGPWARRVQSAAVPSLAGGGTWADSERRSGWQRLRLWTLLVALAVLVGVVALAAGAWSVLERVLPCTDVEEAQVETITGRELDGRRRLRGGCVFDSDESGQEVVLVLTGNAAERRAPGTSGVTISRGEPCGVLVVAPSGAALPRVTESAARRALSTAVCVRPPSGRNSARRGELMAVRIAAAVRRQAAEE